MSFSPRSLIRRKRDGEALTAAEWGQLVAGVTAGTVTDAQVGALLMAAWLQGLDEGEMVALTAAMRDSGRRLELGRVDGPKVDKHSTGGVGDKVSLILAPLVAACGVAVPMISGRGLGHTAGTLDKLEAIPGFRTDLGEDAFAAQVERIGVAMGAQTPDLVPADRRLYAIRDVTATVESVPLIVASILSKKLVEDLDGLVLDIKFGAGAFFTASSAARELGETLVRVATALGTPTVGLLTSMEQPLGRAVGHTVEMEEAFELLQGRGPADTWTVTRALAVEMLLLGGIGTDPGEAGKRIDEARASGRALERMERLIEAQNGDPRVLRDYARMPQARLRREVGRSAAGAAETPYVAAVDARRVAEATILLGAGRQHETDAIDLAVGVTALAKIGDTVEAGAPLGCLHASTEETLREAEAVFRAAFTFAAEPPSAPRLIEARLT